MNLKKALLQGIALSLGAMVLFQLGVVLNTLSVKYGSWLLGL